MQGRGTSPPTIDARRRYPWTDVEDRFLAAAKRQRFSDKAIATALGRTPSGIHERARKLREAGVLLCHREEEIDLLERLLDEARSPEVHAEEAE
jgi:hypothetical protein